jgi:hypothetical protein
MSAERLDDKELVTLKEIMMANAIQEDAIVLLLAEKGITTEEEFNGKLKQVQAEYERMGLGKIG